MRFTTLACLLICALSAISMLAACGTPASTSTAAPTLTAAAANAPSVFPRTVVDSGGTSVEFRTAPMRIISLSPGLTEILFAIGAGDRVAVVDRFSDYPASVASLPRMEYTQPNPEAALAHSPDLVLMTTRQRTQVKQFRDLKMTVLYIEEAQSVDRVIEVIGMLGSITERDAEARALVASMRQRIGTVIARLESVRTGPRVFYEISPDLYTASPETFIGSMLTLLKVQNIALDARTAFPQLSSEAIIAANPEVILLSDAISAKQSVETVASRPGWQAIAAVQSKRIVPIDPNVANRPGPRIVEAIELMARALYPEYFLATAR